MEMKNALDTFAALSQETRLEVFRLLVRHEPQGLAGGEIARQLAAPHNTMSAHLRVATRAHLAVSQRQGRSIIYRADPDHMKETVQFLLRHCSAGHPEV